MTNTSTPMRVLMVEDNEDDAQLTLNELRWAGYAPTWRRVDSLKALDSALSDGPWDVILSDFTLPTCNGLDALRVVRARDTETPFLFVSGTIGEDVAVSAMRGGAQDYILKGNLKRLEPAISRELQERAQRREHKRTVEALAITEARLRKVFESDMLGIMFWGADGVITQANSEFLRLTGRSAADIALASARWTDMFPAAAAGMVVKMQDTLLKTRRCAPVETEIVTGRGSRVPVLLGAALLDGDLNEGAAFVLDLTQAKADRDARRVLEDQLQQTQKMELAARLAGGVAHDFRNLLGVILVSAEMIATTTDATPEVVRSILADIIRAAQQGSSLTQQLLAFGRQQVLVPRSVNPNQIIGDMRSMLERLSGGSISVKFRLGPAAGPVMADPVQLEQIVLNLSLNARDAMPAGGILSISTSNTSVGEGCVTSHGVIPPGSYTMISVSDTGMGMSRRTQARIFEPFFTTKDPGRGTGLGLAAAHGIVAQNGGAISVYSEVGIGTTIKVYFPRVLSDGAEARGTQPIVAAPSRRGTETVLLVEDEQALRAVAASALERQGYTVLVASDAMEALTIARKREDPIHLLFTDMILPGMTGPELVTHLRETRPDVRVLYTSGYLLDDVLPHGFEEDSAPFLPKPYGVADVLERVRYTLDTPRGY